jgi:hypothetical protein
MNLLYLNTTIRNNLLYLNTKHACQIRACLVDDLILARLTLGASAHCVVLVQLGHQTACLGTECGEVNI